jgi:hypothetical protein
MIETLLNSVVNNDNNTYQDTVIGNVFTTINNLHLYIGIAGAQVSPFAYYRGGYTAFGLMGNVESQHTSYMYLYNHNTDKLTIAYNWGAYVDGDYHSNPSTLILPDGRILMTLESNHNNQFVMKRSLKPYDLTSFETIATINDTVAYNNLWLVGDRIYMVSRSFPLIGNSTRYSDDYGETWTTPKNILNTGNYADYWAYPKAIFSKTKISYFMSLSDRLNESGAFTQVYYLESLDGVNFSNKSGNYNRNIDLQELSLTDLNSYYKVRDINPAFNQVHATTSWNEEPFYIIESPTTDGALDFGYFDTTWQTKEITIGGIKLRDANRIEILATGLNSFIVYCCEYDTFVSPETTSSRIIKITTNDNFNTWTHEFLSDGSVFDYSIGASWNFPDAQKSAIISLLPLVRGGGSDVEPTGSETSFKIIDVL